MTVLDWLFVGCLSTAVLTVFLGIFSIVLFFLTNKEYKLIKQKRPKNKQKKKRWLRMRRRLEQKKKQYIKRFVVAMIISGISVGTGLYARYYQMTNLSANDGNAIIQSYFLMDEINKNLIGIQNGADTKKTKDKLLELTSLLASYGTTTPSNALSKDGQRILNRYYAQIRDYSTGLYSQKEEQLNDEGLILEYLEDSKRITGTQKKIFKQFSINESALKQKK